jgi:pSer/pThr/pTyr-binding forkhead associated (FHA) protein
MSAPSGPGQAPVPGNRPADSTTSLPAITAVEAPAEVEIGLNAADQTAIHNLPAGSALLVVQRGPNAGARFLLDAARTTAGRRPDSDIFLVDVTVSRTHAEFVRRGDGFAVRDAGSLNGTYVQRDRIEEVALRDGDEVQIGKYRLVFYPSAQGAPGRAGW